MSHDETHGMERLLNDPVAGERMLCDVCKSEYVLEADAAERPADPAAAVIHDAIPACPYCRHRICERLGIL